MMAVAISANEAVVFDQVVKRPVEVTVREWYAFWDGATNTQPTLEIWEQRLDTAKRD